MTTPTGTITMLDIQNEFGGSSPISLNEYYAGGLYVPTGTSGVPSSGTISMNNLRGKTKSTPVTVTVTPTSRAEGQVFTAQPITVFVQYSTLYWKLTNYTNLQDSDFNVTSGVTSYDYESNSYTSFNFNATTDSDFEGSGTFKITVYSDSARTTAVGESSLLTITDTFSTGTSQLSRTELWRYANLKPSLKTTNFTLNTTGLVGATIYYEIFTDTAGATLTSSDISEPLTGTITVPAGGIVSRSVTAANWVPATIINIVKNVRVRFKLNNSSGQQLALSSNIMLNPTPTFVASASPTTIREGQTTTVSFTVGNMPMENPAAVSLFYTTSGTASLINDFLGHTSTSGEISLTNTNFIFALTAALDTLSETTPETLLIIFRETSISGTAFWVIGDNPPSNPPITITSPALFNSASTSISNVRIASISSYPFPTVFTVQFRNGTTGTLNNSNVTSPSQITVDANQISSNSISMLIDPGGNPGTHSMQYVFTNPSYATQTTTAASETFTWPVGGVTLTRGGSNVKGATVTLSARITGTPTYATLRTFTIEYRVRTAGTTTWGAWTTFPGVSVPVAAGLTSSLTTQLSSGTSTTLLDAQIRCRLAGQQLRESNILTSVWI